MDNSYDYGRVYSEICNKFTLNFLDKIPVYFKHATLAEHFNNYSNYDIFLREGKKRGLYLEETKLKEAIDNNWWSNDKEETISILKKTIQNLFKTKEKLLYHSQKEGIDKQIKRNQSILFTYQKERKEIIGFTLEEFANNKLSDQLLISFTYKDENFKFKLFENIDDYYNSDSDINELKNIYSNYSSYLSQLNIKTAAGSGFFQNLVYLNEDAFSFWGEPTYKCSKYQIDLLLYGKMYKYFIKNQAEMGKSIPEEVLSSPAKFVEYVDNYQSEDSKTVKSSSKSNSKNAVSNPVGATSEDLKKMGIKVEKFGGKSLLELAKEKGGILEKNDYLNARENN